MALEPTADPETFIESRNGNSTTYQNTDGMRWTVTGVCDRRGYCMIGAVVLDGTVVVESIEHLAELTAQYGERIDSEMDVPIGPKFSGCCPFTIVKHFNIK